MRTVFLPRPVVMATMGLISVTAMNARTPVRWQRRLLDASAALAPLPAGTVVRPVTLGGRPADRVTVGASERPRAVLYLHGGAWITGSPRTHRSLVAHLAREAAAVGYVLDYRLAPEHPFPAAVDDAELAFRALLDEGWRPEQVVVAGDSAGGQLAIAVTQRLCAAGLSPAAMVLISPSVDPVHIDKMPRRRDLVVSEAWGKKAAEMYRGTAADDAPGLAPLHGPVDWLPPTLVHAVPNELLYPSICAYVEKAREAGADITLVDLPGLWHVVHSSAGVLRQANEALREMGAWVHAQIEDARARPAGRHAA
jgi:acetyl esterase/lipase